MTNIVNITSKDKELKVAIPNKLFKEIDIYECNSKDGVALQVAKVIHLYYKLFLLTPMNFNKLRLINLNIICEMFNVNATSSTLKAVKDRLIFLKQQGYLEFNKNIEELKKNDLFDIEFLVPDDLLSDGFTFLNANEVEYFLNEEDTSKALVFLFIKRCLNDKRGYAFPTIEYIGFCTTLSKNSIMKALKELKKEGIITIDNPNFYTVDKNTGEIRKSNNTYLFNSDDKKENTYENKKIDLNKYKTVNYHPMSTNFLYETNKITGAIVKTKAYRKWINDFPLEELKGFEEIDWNKKVYLSMQIIAKEGYDTDNCIKSFQDMLSKYYNKGEDNKVQLSNINIIARCEEYEEGKIFFYLEN